ncbi:MAG: ankyrin repeat domain-containing protein [Spirochaetales bacterium]|nr:ankyrin repeat domain-containing protein [Spirochaetales bacterium]
MRKLFSILSLCVVLLASCKTLSKTVIPTSEPKQVVSESQLLFEKLQKYVLANDVASLKILVDDTKPKMLRSVIDNVTENNGRTLLHLAVWDEYPEIVRILLEKEASKTVKDGAGKTAVDYAKKSENKVIRELLGIKDVQEKVSEKKETKKTETVVEPKKVTKEKSVPGFTDASGKYDIIFGATDSKLLIAVKEQNYGEVKKILDSGSNVNVTDLLGNNALFYAINSEHDVMVNLLLSYGISCNTPNNAGRLPFLYAVNKGNISIIEALLNAGASINKGDIEGITAELLAVKNKEVGILKYLESKGSYLLSTDSNGNSLLHIAVKNENIGIVKFLLQNDGDVYAKNDRGVSVLEMMKESKHNGIQAIAQDYE